MKSKFLLLALILPVVILLVLITGLNLGTDALAGPSNQKAAVNENPSAQLSTGFTYQGYLEADERPLDDMYDFSFEVFDAEVDGESWGLILVDGVKVEQGSFTVVLDYDLDVFSGDEVWLEIGVKPEGSHGDYTLFDARQPLTPVPYAHYAVKTGEVDWYDLGQRPEGLDNGDDDTTYNAGFGLELEGTTFNTLTNTLQMRISGSCDYSSAIRAVNPDGSVECESHDTAPGYYLHSVDTFQVVFSAYKSMTIGADGLPIICYANEGGRGFEVAHCNDIVCSSALTNTLDVSAIGRGSAISIGADGLPIITYRDEVDYYLTVIHCDDPACDSFDTNVVTPPITTTYYGYSDIAIGVDGLPVISINGPQGLELVHCSDIACANASSHAPDPTIYVWSLSIAIGTDGLPVVSYYDGTNDHLNFAHCDDIACTSIMTRTLDTVISGHNSITIGSDGLPIISFFDSTNWNLKIAHCNDHLCSSPDIVIIDSGNVGASPSIAIGSDGLPVITYQDNANFSINNIRVSHCNNLSCTDASSVTLLDSEIHMSISEIAIGMDGLPVIMFDKIGALSELFVMHCSNVFCIPNWRP